MAHHRHDVGTEARRQRMIPHRRVTTQVRVGCLLLGSLWTLLGCTEQIPSRVSADYVQHKPTQIAVMPVRNDTGKPLTAPPSHAYVKAFLERTLFTHDPAVHDVSMAWRRKIQYTLHQKAYDVLPLNVVDVRVGMRQTSETFSAEDVKQLLGVDGLLYSTITAWDTQKLITDNTIMVAASFVLIEAGTHKVLWEAEWPYGSVSIKATQPWHDIRYYIARVIDATFATLP